MKTCTRCHIEKDDVDFYKRKSQIDGLDYYCKMCSKELTKVYHSKPEYIKKSSISKREHYKKNRQHYIDRATKRNQENREERNENLAEWREKNREKIRSIARKSDHKTYPERYKNDPIYKLKFVLRARIRQMLKEGGIHPSTEELVGCTRKELKKYLEVRFVPPMDWENHGTYWHIDHIIPCASFDLSKEEEQRKCFHYSNLQPLTAVENIKKGARSLHA